MLLSDRWIRDHIKAGDIGITPFDDRSVQPNSYDLHLGCDFKQSSMKRAGSIDPYDEDSINSAFIDFETEEIVIFPGRFYLGTTIETITLSDRFAGQVFGKSSLARLGISIHETAGFIDAGFSGQITLEITNKHPSPVILRAGMPIAQISFFACASCETPYNKRREAKYNGQKGATLSRYYMNGDILE